MRRTEIAILGANSHIAKGLIDRFLQCGTYNLHLYTTDSVKTGVFLESLGKSCEIHDGYSSFQGGDVIINCIGAGSAPKLKGAYTNYFSLTETYDNLVIGHLKQNPDSLYISMSSGAVYGRFLTAPAEKHTLNPIQVNNISSADYYSITRLYSEAKHRAYCGLNIVDVRIFSYFSRYMNIEDGYFMTELIDCLLNGKVLKTDVGNMVRDYVHPQDLFSLILKCIDIAHVNAAFDAVSSAPVDKRTILEYFSSCGLKYELVDSLGSVGATGHKNIYCSSYNSAELIGYIPEFSSMQALQEEADCIVKQHKGKF